MDAADGDRMLKNIPGVYVHHDPAGTRCEFYAKAMRLSDSADFWQVKLVLLALRGEGYSVGKAEHGHKDQWIQKQGSTYIKEIKIRRLRPDTMPEGQQYVLQQFDSLGKILHIARDT